MSDEVHVPDRLWSIVLANGNGDRVDSFVHRWLGRPQPKQYCAFVGTRSMFQHTVDRAAKVTSPTRTVTVVARAHRQEALTQLGTRQMGTLLFEPANRNTAAGIFLPLTYIRARDPGATVVVFPSDHFVHPEDHYLETVRHAVRTAERLTDRLVLLGVSPDRLELDYGWIERGLPLPGSSNRKVESVRSFLDKPSITQADAAHHAGALWNTLVYVAKIDLLWSLGRQCFPDMMPLFESLSEAIGTPEEGHLLEAIYRAMPARNFSSDLLQRVPENLAVVEVAGVLWNDWGKPERITETLRRIDRSPAFPLTCLDRPFAPIPFLSEPRRAPAQA
ncbi:MAG: sugar phosphate nucleotidyltransferase [Nitrospira sp.]